MSRPHPARNLLKCSHCNRLLGVKVAGRVVALVSGGISDLAIPCGLAFGNGRTCVGGWHDPHRVAELEAVFAEAPYLRVSFGGAEPPAEVLPAPTPTDAADVPAA